MDTGFLTSLIPNVDPGFVRAFKALSVPPDVAATLRTYAVVFHELYLKKKDAFGRRDWKAWEALLQKEATLVQDERH